MIGGTQSKNEGIKTQTFFSSLNGKENPPYFNVYFRDGDEKATLKSSYFGEYRVRGIRHFEDDYDGKGIPKYEIILHHEAKPYVTSELKRDNENIVRNVLRIKSSYSLKGRELLNNFAGAVENGEGLFSISIKEAKKKNPKTGKYDVSVKNKKGEQVYNILIFTSDGKRQLPLFANADFCEHELKQQYVNAEEKCKDAESGKPLVRFWEPYIKNTLQKKAFDIFSSFMETQGVSVEIEDWDEYKLKITANGSSSQTEDSSEYEDVPETVNTDQGNSDDLPF